MPISNSLWPIGPESRHRSLALLVLAGALVLLRPSCAAPERPPLGGMPARVLWAWERPEDLRGLDADTGVAFLAQTVSISGDRFTLAPRRQRLRVDAHTRLLAVSRLESSPAAPVALTEAAFDDLISRIAETRALPRVSGVQIDFDATASERPFYRRLLMALRQRLGSATPLSITALASWCAGDAWLGDLPIDEAVPMLFRMGPMNERYREVALSKDAAADACRGAVGISLDEPLSLNAAGRRVYVFSPKSWNAELIAAAGHWVGK